MRKSVLGSRVKTSLVPCGVCRDRWKEVHTESSRASTRVLLPADVTVRLGLCHVTPRYIIPFFFFLQIPSSPVNTRKIYLYKSFYFALFSWLESQRGLDRLKGMDIWLFLRLFGKLSGASEKECTSPSPPATPTSSICMTPFILLHLKFVLGLSLRSSQAQSAT